MAGFESRCTYCGQIPFLMRYAVMVVALCYPDHMPIEYTLHFTRRFSFDYCIFYGRLFPPCALWRR